ncbi:hypothetical protein M513_05937 [Trichuris suis]|uniref:Kunitz/Bovine pancreatic trypsin inhibitor domain protein n=1 Tax=Trichuris suis TaxID=68888 RepID=A0A085M7N1_9BILA|nr:hypothetical protein M513_05937 [Trichuris suis]
MEKELVVRVQSPEGIKRFNVERGSTVGQLKDEVKKSWPNLPEDFRLSLSRNGANGFANLDRRLASCGIRHGDLLYVTLDKPDEIVEAPLEEARDVAIGHDNSSAWREKAEDAVDLFLYQQPSVIQRDVDPSLCRHGEGTECDNCKPIDVFDSDYLKEHAIKFMSFHAYLCKLGCGKKNGPKFPLEKLDCHMKKDCNRHPPWPKGVCLRCQPPAITLQRQPYRHVDNVCFENEEIGNRFFIYWQKTGYQRFGYLIGRYEPSNDVPLGIVAVVYAIFEPPQISSPVSISTNPIAEQPYVMELCDQLDCTVVGMIFTDLFGHETNGRDVMTCQRNADTYFLTAAECIKAATFQNSFPNICRYSSDNTFGSKFVTVVASGGEDGTVKVFGYQVSNQCAAIVEAKLLTPIFGKPHLVHVKESTKQQCVPSISYRALNEYGSAVMRAATPLPVEFLIVDMPTLGALRVYCSQFASDQELEMASDFHFLYFLLTNEYKPVKMNDLSPLLEAVRTKNQRLAREWFDSNQEWEEMMTLLLKEEVAKSLDIRDTGKEAAGTSSQWRCPHCTFVNRNEANTVIMWSVDGIHWIMLQSWVVKRTALSCAVRHRSCSTSSYVVGRGTECLALLASSKLNRSVTSSSAEEVEKDVCLASTVQICAAGQCQPEPRLLCNPRTYVNAPVGGQLSLYTFCNKDRLVEVGQCQQGYIFDYETRSCQPRKPFLKRKRQIYAIVGNSCNENIDCQTTDGGAYCDTTKRCACLPSFVNIHGFCYRSENEHRRDFRDCRLKERLLLEINPGQSGCSYPEQCNSVWPGAYCYLNECKCPDGQPPQRTRDGTVCTFPGFCPTNGAYSKLKGADGIEASCLEGSDDYCPPTYDCLCNPPAKSAMSACEGATFCCPSRALACIMPRDEGVLVEIPTDRWYYNSMTATCEMFSYRGRNGNANNFVTKSQCESYCKTGCPRGQPLYSPGSMTDRIPKGSRVACSASQTCIRDSNFFCHVNQVAGGSVENYCCPRPSFICSQEGGLPTGSVPYVVPPTPYDSGLSGGVSFKQRYYYDTTERRCKPFEYLGQAGNFNNFDSEAECKQFCSRIICIAGEPMRDQGDKLVTCGAAGTGICPLKYDCTNEGFCCPSRGFVCNQEQAIGSCINYVERWYFNPKSRGCERFYFSGCHGNANNFESYEQCMSFCGTSPVEPKCPQGFAFMESSGIYTECGGASASYSCPADYFCHFDGQRFGCCPTRQKTCNIDPPDPGTLCTGNPVTRWYYNSGTKKCDTFRYNGCDGNSNNFPTRIDCQDYCHVGGCPEGGEPYKEVGTGQYRICDPSTLGCPVGFICTPTTIQSLYVRNNYCCATRATICSLNRDQGVQCGSSSLMRYYFNTVTKTCEPLTYLGCGGNRNNFPSMEKCLSYCQSADCPLGQVALREQNSHNLVSCSRSSNVCPHDYSCIHSKLLGTDICCGSSAPAGTCPAGQSAYMDALTNSPRQCQPNIDNSCPQGFFCTYSGSATNSFCCGTAMVHCPQGGEPYMEPFLNTPRQCTPGVANTCPANYACQTTLFNVGGVQSATGFCCGTPNVCPPHYAPFVQNNQPVTCIPTAFPSVCPAGYTCQRNSLLQQSYCCILSNHARNPCEPNKTPYRVQGAPVVCTQGSTVAGCPPGYTCDLNAESNSFYCCSFSPGLPTTGNCPPGYTLVQPSRYCSPNVPGSCGPNSICHYDSSQARYVCCSSTHTVPPPSIPSQFNPCPSPRQPFYSPTTGQPLACMLGTASSGCPNGYNCAYSAAMKNYFCCSRTGSPGPTRNVCPAGQEPAIDPMTRQPRICPLNVPGFRCPPGYRCTYRAADRQYYCCRAYDGRGVVPGTSQYNEGCPRGRPYIYPGTKTPLSCSPWGSRCPTGYNCLQAIGRSGYLCCSSNFRSRPLPLSSANDTPNAIGSPCTSDSDCRPDPGEEAICHDGTCACSHKEKNVDGQCVSEMCPVPYKNVDGQCQAPQE